MVNSWQRQLGVPPTLSACGPRRPVPQTAWVFGEICNWWFPLPNASTQPRLKAGAQRTLEGVGCSALFGEDLADMAEG
jgi:hypothetical protein